MSIPKRGRCVVKGGHHRSRMTCDERDVYLERWLERWEAKVEREPTPLRKDEA